MELYLEISARATGKTWRLLEAVSNWLNLSEKHIAFIYSPYPLERYKDSYPFKQLIKSKDFNRIFFNQNEWISCGGPIRRFYDDFDFIDFEIEKETDTYKDYHYYTTTPAKIRTIKNIEDNEINKNDNLINLLKRNNGKYVSHSIFSNFQDSNLILAALKDRSKSFKKEYLAKWI